jgi:AcrR family transcriptional regulator
LAHIGAERGTVRDPMGRASNGNGSQRRGSAPRERNDASLFFALESLSGQRARLLEAMARAVAHKGYAKTTVSDVVALAGVSRRTFYEHFSDKEDCFLATYGTGADALIGAVATTVVRSGATEWADQVRIGLEAYLSLLASDPDFAHALLVDVLGAGPRAVQLRRQVFSGFVQLWTPPPGSTDPLGEAARRLPDAYLRALVGGISELVQEHILTHGPETLEELVPTLYDLAMSVFGIALDRDAPRRGFGFARRARELLAEMT